MIDRCMRVCVSPCLASVLQAMAVLVCAEMYQVKRLQHLCEVCVCAYLQSMPSRELASTSISVIRLLRRAKVGSTLFFFSSKLLTKYPAGNCALVTIQLHSNT